MATTKTTIITRAMRPSVRSTTASSQTTSGMTWTRTSTCSSQCTTSTPMTTFTQTLAWCTSCAELAHSAHSSTLDDHLTPHLAQVLSKHFVIHGHIHGAFSLIRPLPSSFTFPSCPFPSTSSTTSCSLSSTTRSSWKACATPPQKRVRAPWTPSTLTQVMSPTSWPSASSTTHQSPSPSWSRPRTKTWMTWHSARCSQRHTEDKSITANQKACQSVSQSSSSVRFDGSGQPDERNSSNAQIRTLLEEQRQTIIAEYREKVSHHELHAAHAEEERRLLQGQLWRQKLEFREAHQQSLTEMEELRKFQSSTFDAIARRSSRIRTLFWNYQAEYRNCKMK